MRKSIRFINQRRCLAAFEHLVQKTASADDLIWKMWLFIGVSISHRIHGTGIFPYMYHKIKPNVGKYTSPMDPMGIYLHDLSL